MVIHEESETPVEVPVIKKPAVLEQSEYIIVKNHVRELTVENKEEFSEDKLPETTQKKKRKKSRKSAKLEKIRDQSSTSCTENDDTNTVCEISASDLKELKIVYGKCKAVLKKIENKYGHLLDLNEDVQTCDTQSRKRKIDSEYESEECKCSLNRKIVFHEDGTQSMTELSTDNHICSKKLKKIQDNPQKDTQNLCVEYENNKTLPDDLITLSHMLKDPDLNINHRNDIIKKMTLLRQEYMNELRFNKETLKEKLKSDADAMLDFNGANLSSITGYK